MPSPGGDDSCSAAPAAAAAAESFSDSDDADVDTEASRYPNTAAAAAGANAAAAAALTSGERRPLFQRLWTEEDELIILRGFAEFTAARGTAFASHQYDTDPFYEDMRRRLQMDFTKSQLSEKLRRLKRKYRNCVSRLRENSASAAGPAFQFRSPHEQAVFEIARNIWRPTTKRGRGGENSDDEDESSVAANANAVVAVEPNGSNGSAKPGRRRRRNAGIGSPAAASTALGTPMSLDGNAGNVLHSAVSEPAGNSVNPLDAMPLATVALPVFPTAPSSILVAEASPQPEIAQADPAVVKTEYSDSPILGDADRSFLTPLFKEIARAVIGNATAFGAPPLGLWEKPGEAPPLDEKWRKQRILELEVYLKRIELLQDHVKATLEELKSSPAK